MGLLAVCPLCTQYFKQNDAMVQNVHILFLYKLEMLLAFLI